VRTLAVLSEKLYNKGMPEEFEEFDVKALGQRLKALREERGWSLRQAAERAGISHEQVRDMEAGNVPNVTWKKLSQLARAYGTTAVNLIGAQWFDDTFGDVGVIRVPLPESETDSGTEAAVGAGNHIKEVRPDYSSELKGVDVNLLAIKEMDEEEFELIARQLAERREKLERERREMRNAQRRRSKAAKQARQADKDKEPPRG
jgi:transcriptional regulator with XRE-family HTH domain